MKRSSRNFSCSQVIESSWQYLLLRTDILQKTVVGCPCVKLFRLVGSCWYSTSSETQGQSVGPGLTARRTSSSMGGRAHGYRLSPDHSKRPRECWFLTGHKKFFALLCPIGEQHLLSSFREFVHDGYYLATVARFVHQAFLTRNEGTTDESKNVSDAISRSNLICTEKILFLTDHNVS